jgi:hypothetical protein
MVQGIIFYLKRDLFLTWYNTVLLDRAPFPPSPSVPRTVPYMENASIFDSSGYFITDIYVDRQYVSKSCTQLRCKQIPLWKKQSRSEAYVASDKPKESESALNTRWAKTDRPLKKWRKKCVAATVQLTVWGGGRGRGWYSMFQGQVRAVFPCCTHTQLWHRNNYDSNPAMHILQ